MDKLKPYIPHELPLRDLGYKALLSQVGVIHETLGRYDGLLQGIRNPSIMLSPLLRREAVLSSKIEGTQVTEIEALEYEAGFKQSKEKEADSQEVLNYRSALRKAAQHLKTYPITLDHICGLHKILMNSVRGKSKKPGEFRKEQNWIGDFGCKMEDATFIPPSPLQLNDHLQKWQTYLNSNSENVLLQTAVIHAQFELLHPFLDGNGRIGRILIPLFLFQKKVLSRPVFYLSEYLETNREEYYQRLQNISQKNDWTGWLMFFLTAIHEQAQQNSKRVCDIQQLYEETKEKILSATHSQYGSYILDAIFDAPIFQVSKLAQKLNQEYNVHPQTAADLLRKLKDKKIVSEHRAGRGRSSAIYVFLDLFKEAER